MIFALSLKIWKKKCKVHWFLHFPQKSFFVQSAIIPGAYGNWNYYNFKKKEGCPYFCPKMANPEMTKFMLSKSDQNYAVQKWPTMTKKLILVNGTKISNYGQKFLVKVGRFWFFVIFGWIDQINFSVIVGNFWTV